MLKKKIAAAFLSIMLAVSCLPFTNACADGVVIGDVDGDGSVQATDALLVLRASLDMESFTPEQSEKADINADGSIDSSDALFILKIAVRELAGTGRAVELGSLFEYEKPVKGIDVSFWQGDIDFKKVKESGVDFVIIRAGGATDDPSENHKDVDPRRQGVDSCFEKNYAAAKAAGLNVGVYWYSFAENKQQALREAESCLKAIEGKKLEYPVFYDIENNYQFDKGQAFCSELMKTFCEKINDNGYYAAFYMSTYFATNYLDDEVKSSYDCWLAQWSTPITYAGDYGMWQMGVTQVDGINGDVDDDVSYINYPLYIKARKLNGW